MLTWLFQIKLIRRIRPDTTQADRRHAVFFFFCCFFFSFFFYVEAHGYSRRPFDRIPSTRKTPEHGLENVTTASVDMGREVNECNLNLS